MNAFHKNLIPSNAYLLLLFLGCQMAQSQPGRVQQRLVDSQRGKQHIVLHDVADLALVVATWFLGNEN